MAGHPLAPGYMADDRFVFDAPQFIDFLHPRYRRRRDQLQLIVETPCKDLFSISDYQADDDLDDDTLWFQQAHPSHEPTDPPTPPGPLITPPHVGLRAAPQRVNRTSSSSSSFRISSLPSYLNTPTVDCRMRSSVPKSPLAVAQLGITKSPLAAPAATKMLGGAKRIAPVEVKKESPEVVAKRFKVDAKFTPAPLIVNKKKPTVRMDDLKKMLAEHNQRIRPILKR